MAMVMTTALSDSNFLGTGWTFPPTFDGATDQLHLSSGDANIKQSIDVVLQTPKGSRSLQPTYGCDLSRFIFRQIDATAQAQMIESVKQTLLDCEPRIKVESVAFSSLGEGSMVALNICFQIKQTNTRHNHVFPFSLIEGTLLNTGRHS